ncbi:carbohydrate porin [Ningiella sp. W23]|uniref:carbohydrate porin n=1 Tax=Ningiella sp. W23 TaxID=3023715 RepID=UPI003757F548
MPLLLLCILLSCVNLPVFGGTSFSAPVFSAQYDIDFLKNTQGGISTDFEYLDLAQVSMAGDGKLSSDIDLEYFASAIYSNGNNFSQDIVGDDHIVSNLEGGAGFTKFAQAWVNLNYKRGSLLLGLYDINEEFDVLQSANLFINSGHGIGNDIGLSGANGPSIYPFYGLSARLKLQVSDNQSIKLAIIDGSPGDADKPSSIGLELSSDEGAFLIAEYEVNRHAEGRARWLFGAWQYTKSIALESEQASSGNFGVYLRHERELVPELVDVFFRVGSSDDKFYKYNGFASAGLIFQSFSTSRPLDTFGIALAYHHVGDSFAAISESAYTDSAPGTGNQPLLAKGELNLEITYQAILSDKLTLQPMMQYISKPAALDQGSALALGLRVSVNLL